MVSGVCTSMGLSMSNGAARNVCPYCGGDAVISVSAPDINRKITPVVFHQWQCTQCQLRFIVNPPENIGQYYDGEYNHLWTTLEDLDRIAVPHEHFKIDILLAAKTSGKLLEIGASNGAFCRMAQQAGFEVHAVELNEACVDFMNNTIGIHAIRSADPAAVLQASTEQYDAICLWHTIEHLQEPWRVLELAAARLAPDGVLVIAAPNPDAWQARMLGARWPHHDMPRHLFHLPIPWIRAVAPKIGLAVEDITTRDEGSLFWNRFTWAMVMRSWASKDRMRMRLWNAGMFVGRLLQPWEGRQGAGAAYTAILRRVP
jgi:2-polyprenyl-3-methyl-5-hydroxy-6-metoxy-1,4-benzoquinol methylase